MAGLSQEMIEKLKYASETLVQEFLILKKDEEERGNVQQYNVQQYNWLNVVDQKQYSWLNVVDRRGRIQPIVGIIGRMFATNNATLASVISDYFVPEDVVMLRRFVDDYYIHVYKYTQEGCDNKWKDQNIFNQEYSNTMFELGMYFYMNIHQKLVINQLYHGIDNNDKQLK